MAAKSFVIVGLGNPGEKYAKTRHNVGYMTIERLAARYKAELKADKKFSAKVGRVEIGGVKTTLLLPTTYMNSSGLAVRQWLDYNKLTADDVIVVSDDVDLPIGALRVRMMGSAGGHNGLKSIESYLGTSHYLRLRMGIGFEEEADSKDEKSLADYVLANFNPKEVETLNQMIEMGADVLERLAQEPATRVMTAVNTRRTVRRENESTEA